MMKVGWTKKRKYKKGYYIYHFYFCLAPFNWWSIHYKIRGNKRVRPEKLILHDARKKEIKSYPYNLTEDLMDGWIELQPKRWDEIMEELKRRDHERIKIFEQIGELIKNVKNF